MKQILKVFFVLLIGFSQPSIAHKNKDIVVVQDGIEVSNAWAREGSPNTAIFMTLTNTTAENRKIVRAKTSIAKRNELHDHLKEGNIMRMRQIEAIEVPAGGQVELQPGGKHVMLIGLDSRLEEGSNFQLELALDNGDELTMEIPVKPVGYKTGCPCPGKEKKSDCHCNE